MKTIEEIRSAVLAYCEDVCPNRDSPRVTDWGDFVFGYVNDGGKEYEAWFLHIGNFNRPIPLYALTDAKTWIAAYRILGLETRDAVEAYKASLQSDLKSMTSIVASVKNGEQPDYVHISKITELESRNAALVVALEEIRKPAMIISLGKATNRDRAEQLTEDHKRVRMIAQSALSANTEKGGAKSVNPLKRNHSTFAQNASPTI